MATKSKAKDKIVGFLATAEILQRVDREAENKGVSRSDVIRWAIVKYFEATAA